MLGTCNKTKSRPKIMLKLPLVYAMFYIHELSVHKNTITRKSDNSMATSSHILVTFPNIQMRPPIMDADTALNLPHIAALCWRIKSASEVTDNHRLRCTS